MPFQLVPEEEMEHRKKQDKTTKKPELHVLPKEESVEIEKKIPIRKAVSEGDVVIRKVGPLQIVKKIYFPDALYSDPEKQNEFKKIIKESGLSWVPSHEKKYSVNLTGGLYASPNEEKKILSIYEGENKPATFIVKIVGDGGNFLIDLLSFCNKIGCVIEDKDEIYVNNLLLRLKEFGDLNVQEAKKGGVSSHSESEDKEKERKELAKKEFELKIKTITDEKMIEWENAYGDLLKMRGINIEVARLFKRREVEENIRWALEKSFY